jgi:hypothetical protein
LRAKWRLDGKRSKVKKCTGFDNINISKDSVFISRERKVYSEFKFVPLAKSFVFSSSEKSESNMYFIIAYGCSKRRKNLFRCCIFVRSEFYS